MLLSIITGIRRRLYFYLGTFKKSHYLKTNKELKKRSRVVKCERKLDLDFPLDKKTLFEVGISDDCLKGLHCLCCTVRTRIEKEK